MISDEEAIELRDRLREYDRRTAISNIDELKSNLIEYYGIEIMDVTDNTSKVDCETKYTVEKCKSETCNLCMYKSHNRCSSYFEYEVEIVSCDRCNEYNVNVKWEDWTDLLSISKRLEDIVNYDSHSVGKHYDSRVTCTTVYVIYRYPILYTLHASDMDKWHDAIQERYPDTDHDTVRNMYCILTDAYHIFLYYDKSLSVMQDSEWSALDEDDTVPDTLYLTHVQYEDDDTICPYYS